MYEIFKADFISSQPIYENKPVKIRYMPKVDGFEQSFFHVTTCDYLHNTDRAPDAKRCERIRWVRAFIENYDCNMDLCEECEGLKVWEEPSKMYQRVHILFEEERYIVILEKREQYNLLITAYYCDYNHTLEKLLKRYQRFKNNKTRLA